MPVQIPEICSSVVQPCPGLRKFFQQGDSALGSQHRLLARELLDLGQRFPDALNGRIGAPAGRMSAKTRGKLPLVDTHDRFKWFNVLDCQSATRSALGLDIFRNRWLMGGLDLSIVLQASVSYWPPLNTLFHTVPIPLADLLPIVAVASGVLWMEELRKGFIRWRRSRSA